MMKFSKRKNRAKNKNQRLVTAFTPRHENLEDRRLLAAENVFHNASMPTDVNGDGITSPIDALFTINELNSPAGSRDLRINAPVKARAFLDVSNDGFMSPMDSLMVINVLNAEAEGEGDMFVQIRLQPTDTDGNAISQIGVGEDFVLQAFVQDLTDRVATGVFAAYLDVEYQTGLVAVNGDIDHSSSYGNGPSGTVTTDQTDCGENGDATCDRVDEVGSFDGISPLGSNELPLFSIPMTANVAGTVDFEATPADQSNHTVLLFGGDFTDGTPLPNSGIVDPEMIMYLGASLQIGTTQVPTAASDGYETNEDTVLNVDAATGVLSNDTNPGAGDLSAVLGTDVSNGSLNLSSDGSFTYTPDAGFDGTDSFTYTATDADNNASTAATVTITVRPLNAAPVAQGDSYNVDEDNTLTANLSILDNDTDADSDNLTAVLESTTANGTLNLNQDGTFTYTPDPNYNGSDSFTYRANDGQVDSEVATVSITVSAVNDGPAVVDDNYSIASGTDLVVEVANGLLANDSDIDGDSLEVVTNLTSDPSNGTVTVQADGSFTYAPNNGFTGQDSFGYTATDGEATDEGTVTVSVTGDSQVVIRLAIINEFGNVVSSVAPGSNFTLQGFVDDVSELPQEGVFSAYLDVTFDNGLVTAVGPIAYGTSYGNGQKGTIDQAGGEIDEVGAFDGLMPLGADELLLFSVAFTANQAGTVLFASNPADERGGDVTLFGVNDPIPTSQVEYGSVSLNIQSGDPPTAVDDSYSTDEDVVLTVTAANGVLANDTDPSDEMLNAVLVNTTTNGTLDLDADGSFVYTPNVDFFGEDVFTYRANDGGTSSENVASVTITVNSIDDAPVAIDDTYRLDDAGTLVVDALAGVLANDSDAEGDSLSVSIVTGPTEGELTLNGDGSFSYTPTSNLVGRDTFTYQITAGGKMSNIATVTIDIGDLTPSSIAGFVYVDSNNDGVKADQELVLGDVLVSISGTNLLGEEVDLSTRTASDGSYSFNGLLRGEYTLIETQPLFMIDGIDSHGEDVSLRNDRFIVQLAAGTSAQNYNFGERGLEPEFIGNSLFFGSRAKTGLFAALNPNGEQAWYCFDAGWDGLASVNVDLAMNGATLDLTGTDAAGNSDTETIRVSGNSNVRVMGDMQRGMLVRMNGSAAGLGIDPVAVDGVFDDG